VIAREPGELLVEARAGSRGALARLLTYVESGGESQRATAALSYAAPAPYVVGITGAPGGGKSTLTDQLIGEALTRSLDGSAIDEVGVLCVDPSSPFTGGAILGDRIRMQAHATDTRVYIRSMATRGHLGGLSLAVPDALRVLGAVGFPLSFVETVGVGQLEVEVASSADTTIVVVTPGWGDAMQANKAGLLEVADVFVVNKADRAGVAETRRDLAQMLDLGGDRQWRPPILDTVATTGDGVEKLMDAILQHRNFVDGRSHDTRRAKARAELERVLAAMLRERVGVIADGAAYEAQVDALVAGTTDPYQAAESLIGLA